MPNNNNSQAKDKFPTFRKIFPFFFFERCISKKEVRKVKIIYLVIFVVLIVAPLLVMSIYWSLYEEELHSPYYYPGSFQEAIIEGGKALAGILTVFSKLLLLYVTIWAASKFGIRTGWRILLGVMAVLPILIWISVIIILTRRPSVEAIIQKKATG